MPFSEVKFTVDYELRKLCLRRYPNHPHGCPNYGQRKTCPPQAPYVGQFFDLENPTYIIWSVFDFRSHVVRMESLHPEWTDRQKQCCLYWQPKARKVLEQEIQIFRSENPSFLVSRCPEAMGVDVTRTMLSIGEQLEWPPRTKTYQVAIAGTRLIS